MRATRLHEGRTDLSVEELPDPVLRPGCAVVRIESVFMSPYMASLIDGTSGLELPPRPFTPGMDAIGTVESIADDVEGLAPGDQVYCDSYIEVPKADCGGDYAFIGCFAISANSGPLLARWPDGALATHMLLPAECLTQVGPALARTSADALCRMGWFGTAHSAFEKTGFQPSQSVAVLGATGLLGVSAVLVALAMGADRIIAVGRSKERLAAFDGFDPRIETAMVPPGAGDAVDLVISAIGGGESRTLEDSIKGIKRFGSLVVLGSLDAPPRISDLITRDVTVRGSLWFPRAAPSRLVRMIENGTLPVSRIRSHTYSLDNVGGAVEHCARAVPPFEQVVVRP